MKVKYLQQVKTSDTIFFDWQNRFFLATSVNLTRSIFLCTTRNLKLLLLLCCCLFLTACASKKEKPTGNEPVVQALFAQLNEWKGTPYRYGGESKSGIDCSAFVQITYTSLFNKKLPRSTSEQAKLGKAVKPKEHRPGDLIFFKTDGAKQINHVGIYAENNTFIHASTTKGVIRSSLNNPYWQKTYAYSRRVTTLPSFTN